MNTRLPRTYVGRNHETLGSDILAVVKALHAPERPLGPLLAARLQQVKPEGWYPIGMLLEALEVLDAKLGTYALRNVGWELFQMTHAAQVRASVASAHALLHGFDGMYHRANRGEGIGGWRVLSFGPGRAELEKTTPHHCVMEEGILQEALRTIGVKAEVAQRECFRRGADACIYVVTSPVTDQRWSGTGLGTGA